MCVCVCVCVCACVCARARVRACVRVQVGLLGHINTLHISLSSEANLILSCQKLLKTTKLNNTTPCTLSQPMILIGSTP